MTLPKKHLFHMPEGVIYFDGNSLGPLPIGTEEKVQNVLQNEWGNELIRAWNSAGWMAQPERIGDKIARIIGTDAGTVAVGDTLSIKVYQAVAAGLKRVPDRRVILSDTGNFPTDLYMAQGLIDTIDKDYELRTVAREDVWDAITDEVGVVMLTHVDFRDGRMHDMDAITKKAHAHGAVMIWDLAHSAGALDLDLKGSNAEFAVGCTYKHLNAGPGAPAFIYARPDLALEIEPALAGWLGHDAPFAMDLSYRPAMSTQRLRVGTPSVIQMAILEHALEAWDDVDMADLRAASMRLSTLFIDEVEAACPSLTLVSPRDANLRGAQVAFGFEHGYPAIRALLDRGVIGDFRPPNIMRFGISPMFLDEEDIVAGAKIIADVINNDHWAAPEYQEVLRVT